LLKIEEFELLNFDDNDFDFQIPTEELNNLPDLALGEVFKTKEVETQIEVIKRYPRQKNVKYERAVDLVEKIPVLQNEEAVYAVVSGNFIFGDFIEAFMVQNNYFADDMRIATLSLSQENVDSLRNLQKGEYLQKMSLIVSDFWFAHENREGGGVPYIVENLGCENFRFAVAGLHTKVAIIKTSCGKHFVFHGSANLRSSGNIEQFCIENNVGLFNFNLAWMEKILCNFFVTNKSARGKKLWQTITALEKNQN